MQPHYDPDAPHRVLIMMMADELDPRTESTLSARCGGDAEVRAVASADDRLDRILDRLNFISGVALAAIAVLPVYVVLATGVQFYLGSTSLLIIVGVALDTMQQIEARLVMRNYQGFMKQ